LFFISHKKKTNSLLCQKHNNLIYKDECLFVYLYGTYANPHFWTDLNQTSHTSPPWSEGGRRVCKDPKFLTFSTFWRLFSLGATAESWAQDGCKRDRFPWYPYIRELRSVFLWRHTGGALHPRHVLPRQRFVCYSCTCSCDVTHTMLWRATIAHSYCAFLALCVMHRKRRKDSNTHTCKRGNLMTLGGG